MKLTPMSEAEYAVWSRESRASYAQDKMKANGVTIAEAEKFALDDFNRLLPDGLYSRDNFLYSARDEYQNLLGYIWFNIRGTVTKRAFVCDVVIEKQHRGKGFGRQIMELMELEVKKLGLKRIGLHVFGFNERAISLYQSLGYSTVDLIMEKTL